MLQCRLGLIVAPVTFKRRAESGRGLHALQDLAEYSPASNVRQRLDCPGDAPRKRLCRRFTWTAESPTHCRLSRKSLCDGREAVAKGECFSSRDARPQRDIASFLDVLFYLLCGSSEVPLCSLYAGTKQPERREASPVNLAETQWRSRMCDGVQLRSPAQVARTSRFVVASRCARTLLMDPAMRKLYQQPCRDHLTPDNITVSDYALPAVSPVINRHCGAAIAG